MSRKSDHIDDLLQNVDEFKLKDIEREFLTVESFQKRVYKVGRVFKKSRFEKLDDFTTAILLGQGNSGVTYLSYYNDNNKPNRKEWAALKLISVFDLLKRDEIEKDISSVFFYHNNNHLVGLTGVFYQEGTLYFVSEYMEGGSLDDVVNELNKTNQKLDEACISIISKQIIEGLQYIHQTSRIVQREVKPTKILMNRFGKFKIREITMRRRRRLHQNIGNINVTYMSPERLSGTRYTRSSDIWSFGLILVFLATGKKPYLKENGKEISNFWEVLNHLKRKDPPRLKTSDGFSDEIVDFVARCLEMKPGQRYTCEQLLRHPFIVKHQDNLLSLRKYGVWWRRHLRLNLETRGAPFKIRETGISELNIITKKEDESERVRYVLNHCRREHEENDYFGINITGHKFIGDGDGVITVPKIFLLELDYPFPLSQVLKDIRDNLLKKEEMVIVFSEEVMKRVPSYNVVKGDASSALDKLEF